MADEMKIKKSYEYDKKNDALLKPANYAQVIMARGLIKTGNNQFITLIASYQNSC